MYKTADEYDYLHRIMLIFNESLIGEELYFDSNEYYKYEFFKKMYNQYITLSSLSNGSQYHTKDGTYKVNDVTSVIVLLRSVLETLLMFFYLFLDARDKEDYIFRLNCWRRQGILTRYNLSKESNSYKQNGMLKDEKRLKELSKIIKNTKYWKTIINKKDFERFGLFSPSWKTILKKLSENRFITDKMYSFLSSYAHSEYLNLSQLAILDIEKKTDNTIDIYRRIVFPIYSTFLILFLKVVDIKITLDKDQMDYLIACSDFFCKFQKNHNEINQEN